MSDYLVTDTELGSIADAIRTKGGISGQLVFPSGFVNAIDNIPAGGSPILTLGAIRPDATLYHEVTKDVLLVTDESVTIPAYSTSAQTLVNSENLTQVTLPNHDLYDYFITWRTLAVPIYNTSANAAGKQEFGCFVGIEECINAKFTSMTGNKSYSLNLNKSLSQRLLGYWATSSSFRTAGGQTNGIYTGNVSLTINYSGTDIKVNASISNCSIKGNQTYLNQTYWDAMTDIRYQYSLQYWRAPVGSLNYDGWSIQQLLDSINSALHSGTQELE